MAYPASVLPVVVASIYSVPLAGLVALSLLIQVEIVKSSVAEKSRSASFVLDAQTVPSPLKALPNLPKLVNPPVVVEKTKSFVFVLESQKSLAPPEQVFKDPSSKAQ